MGWGRGRVVVRVRVRGRGVRGRVRGRALVEIRCFLPFYRFTEGAMTKKSP